MPPSKAGTVVSPARSTKKSPGKNVGRRLSLTMHADEIERVKTNNLTCMDKLRRNPCAKGLLGSIHWWPIQGTLLAATFWAIYAQDVLAVSTISKLDENTTVLVRPHTLTLARYILFFVEHSKLFLFIVRVAHGKGCEFQTLPNHLLLLEVCIYH